MTQIVLLHFILTQSLIFYCHHIPTKDSMGTSRYPEIALGQWGRDVGKKWCTITTYQCIKSKSCRFKFLARYSSLLLCSNHAMIQTKDFFSCIGEHFGLKSGGYDLLSHPHCFSYCEKSNFMDQIIQWVKRQDDGAIKFQRKQDNKYIVKK